MAVEITISIPDKYVNRVLTVFTELSGKNIELMLHSDDLDGNWNYSLIPKDIGETNKQFATRVIKETVRALVKLYDYAKDRERYRIEIGTIQQPSQDVPDEIVE